MEAPASNPTPSPKPALDVFLTLAVFRQESWTGQRGNEFGDDVGNDVDGLPQGRIEAFPEGPLLPLDPTREEAVLKELLKEAAQGTAPQNS